MESLETELERARELDVEELADAIESIGFECTRCGGCCTGEAEELHTATVFPEEVRDLQDAGEYDWRDVARPMPYGLDGDDGGSDGGTGSGDAVGDSAADEGAAGETAADDATDQTGTTFEWALQTDACGDCAFYEERDDTDPTGSGGAEGGDADTDGTGADDADADEDPLGPGYCTVHEDRPLICQTYPFSVALGGTTQPMGEAVDEAGMVRAHECEGLGRDITREDAEELAAALKERAIRELEEAIGVRDNYQPTDVDDVVVHDSEGQKRPDGTPLGDEV